MQIKVACPQEIIVNNSDPQSKIIARKIYCNPYVTSEEEGGTMVKRHALKIANRTERRMEGKYKKTQKKK
jgi:hypothetical protein